MKKIKVALIGTGNWSLQHCRVLTQHPQVEFCGILGRNKERTKKELNFIMSLTILILKILLNIKNLI